ncbi:MAG TPA: anti-sigma factor [Gammaproteobacteria bacterium]|nr:anti-sigma factor [Gammaproteobacteria bacterium]
MTDGDLHRFIDGELSESRSRRVASAIAADAALGEKVERYREIDRRLGEIYRDSEAEALPSRFLIALSGRGYFTSWRVAAAILWTIVGGLIGYSLQAPVEIGAVIRPLPVEAASAHAVYVPEVRHPVEVGAAEQEHLNAWLSKRLERPIAAPDLRAAGYALIGGRLLADAYRPAAQFMFESKSGDRITLYIRHAADDRETSFAFTENDGFGVVYWIDDGLAYALTAAADRATLTTAAELVYRELNP